MARTKLAVLHSFPGLAEQETATRIQVAAARLGWDAAITCNHAEVDAVAPDFVLCLSHHEMRPPNHPSYGLANAPLSWLAADVTSLGRLLAHDGILTTTDPVAEWLERLSRRCLGQSVPQQRFYPTIAAQTPLPPRRPGASRLAYVGTNWDGWRNHALFQSLGQRGDVLFFGLPQRWAHVPAASRGGALPFDGHSVVEAYARCGIGLGLDRPDFLADDIPTNRIFEITAAGAFGLMSETPFMRRHFGDYVAALDHLAAPSALAWQIGQHLDWIARHQGQADDMARAAQAAFNQNFAMEHQLRNLLAFHERVSAFGRPPARQPPDRQGLATFAAPYQVDPCHVSLEVDLGQAPSTRLWLWPSQGQSLIDAYYPATNEAVTIQACLRCDASGQTLWQGPLAPAAPIGGMVRHSATLPDQGAERWVRLELSRPALGALVRQSFAAPSIPVAALAGQGRVWIYGAGAGGLRVAQQVTEAGGTVAALIDDFRHDRIQGHAVAPMTELSPHMAQTDVLVLANQHWPMMWEQARRLAPGQLYVAHPNYDGNVRQLPRGRE